MVQDNDSPAQVYMLPLEFALHHHHEPAVTPTPKGSEAKLHAEGIDLHHYPDQNEDGGSCRGRKVLFPFTSFLLWTVLTRLSPAILPIVSLVLMMSRLTRIRFAFCYIAYDHNLL
jgi:hypothetical protein